MSTTIEAFEIQSTVLAANVFDEQNHVYVLMNVILPQCDNSQIICYNTLTTLKVNPNKKSLINR